MIRTNDLLRMRWRLGARGPDWIDCLGVCLLIAQRLGKPFADPWPRLLQRWRGGENPGALLDEGPGDGWFRFEPTPRVVDGDLWIMQGAHLGAGMAHAGRIWTATEQANVIAREPRFFQPIAAWRQ